ncbi:MAG: CHAP domain-containing protein, partial [Oscillospiraceae bacterium]|nr:CHAP domain-containing protein [Oscillospiraceae bacterium]
MRKIFNLKKIIATLTAAMMIFTVCSSVTGNQKEKTLLQPITSEAAASDFTAAQAVAWANNCASTKWDKDVDGAYGTQCVDLILAYYSYLGVSRSKGHAKDYQTNTLPSGWKRVKSSPQPGDVIVWAGNTKINSSYTLSKYGHVGIVVAVSGNKLTTVETNADLNVSYAQKKSRDASYAACFIRPNFSGSSHTCTNMTTGEYYLKNSSTNTYMQAASASNEAKVSLAAKKETANFMFNLTGNTSEGYYLETKSNAGFVVNP